MMRYCKYLIIILGGINMAKRANGEGTTYYNEKRKLWIHEQSYIDNETGEKCRKKFAAKTQKEALAKGREFKKSIDNGLISKANKITVGEWVDCWLNDYIKMKVRPRTWEKYKSCIDCYIKPRYQKVLLKDLKSPDLQRHFNSLLQTGGNHGCGISSSTVRGCRRYFSMCLDSAIKAGLLEKNIVKLTESPKLTKAEIVTLSPDEIKLLLSKASSISNNDYINTMFPTLLEIALHTGMRQGELLGLKWTDIDFDANCIYIRRSLTFIVGKGAVFQEPKTNTSKRRILLTRSDIELLKKYRNLQYIYSLELGDKYIDSNLVFCGMFGQPMHVGNLIKRYFKPLIKLCNIQGKFTFHCLRHTHATLLLQQGVNPKIVQERLGHSSIKMTMDIYSHVLPDMQNVAINALDKIFN